RQYPAIPVLSRNVPGGRLQGAARRLQLLRQQGSGCEAAEDAGDGREQALAGRARGDDRPAADGRQRHPRILPAAASLAQEAEPGAALWLVGFRRPSGTSSATRPANASAFTG